MSDLFFFYVLKIWIENLWRLLEFIWVIHKIVYPYVDFIFQERGIDSYACLFHCCLHQGLFEIYDLYLFNAMFVPFTVELKLIKIKCYIYTHWFIK